MSEVEVPDDFAVPKGVVKCNDASLPHQEKTELVVAVVALLVGINKGKVKILFSCRHEGLECVSSGSDLQSDLLTDSSLAPKLLGDVSEVLIDVTSNNNTIYKININTSKTDQYRPSGRAKAAARLLAPVKTPTSMTFLAARLLMRRALREITSGAPIIRD